MTPDKNTKPGTKLLCIDSDYKKQIYKDLIYTLDYTDDNTVVLVEIPDTTYYFYRFKIIQDTQSDYFKIY